MCSRPQFANSVGLFIASDDDVGVETLRHDHELPQVQLEKLGGAHAHVIARNAPGIARLLSGVFTSSAYM